MKNKAKKVKRLSQAEAGRRLRKAFAEQPLSLDVPRPWDMTLMTTTRQNLGKMVQSDVV